MGANDEASVQERHGRGGQTETLPLHVLVENRMAAIPTWWTWPPPIGPGRRGLCA